MKSSFKRISILSLCLSLLFTGSLEAQQNNRQGDRNRGERSSAQARGQRQAGARAEQINVEEVEVKAPGRLYFVGKNDRHENKGIFTKWHFTKIDVKDHDYTKGSVELEIDINSILTQRQRLTNHLLSEDFFHVEEFPKAKVTLKNAKAVEGKENSYTAEAIITFAGAEAKTPVTFTVNADNPAEIKGEAIVSRTSIKVGAAVEEGNPRSIEDEVKITFEFTLPDDVKEQSETESSDNTSEEQDS